MFSRRSSITENENQVDSDQKVDDWQGMSLPITDEPNITDLRQKIRESKSVFVEVQNLTKGQTFVSELPQYSGSDMPVNDYGR